MGARERGETQHMNVLTMACSIRIVSYGSLVALLRTQETADSETAPVNSASTAEIWGGIDVASGRPWVAPARYGS